VVWIIIKHSKDVINKYKLSFLENSRNSHKLKKNLTAPFAILADFMMNILFAF
jgi:hypothetical protein